jgi:hypothetical protein
MMEVKSDRQSTTAGTCTGSLAAADRVFVASSNSADQVLKGTVQLSERALPLFTRLDKALKESLNRVNQVKTSLILIIANHHDRLAQGRAPRLSIVLTLITYRTPPNLLL